MSHVFAVSRSVTGVAVKNSVHMLPTRLNWTGTPAADAAFSSPVPMRALCSSSRAYGGFAFSSDKVAIPAAIATGLPESVPAWNTGPAGMIWRMMSARPPYAPTG